MEYCSYVDDTEMNKAKKLLKSDVNMAEIARKTKISNVSLSKYRTSSTDINKAQWSIIHKLAQAWDDQQIQKFISANDYHEFTSGLNDWFDDLEDSYFGNDFQNVIARIKAKVISDPVFIVELYQAYSQGTNNSHQKK